MSFMPCITFIINFDKSVIVSQILFITHVTLQSNWHSTEVIHYAIVVSIIVYIIFISSCSLVSGS